MRNIEYDGYSLEYIECGLFRKRQEGENHSHNLEKLTLVDIYLLSLSIIIFNKAAATSKEVYSS